MGSECLVRPSFPWLVWPQRISVDAYLQGCDSPSASRHIPC